MGMTAQFKILDDQELGQMLTHPESIEDILFPDDAEDPFEDQTDIDKSWHQLHYLLTGSLEPDGSAVGDAILGGSAVGPDLGYGPARLIPSERVNEIANALRTVDIGERYEGLDQSLPALSHVYSGFDFVPGEKETLQFFFEQLRSMYALASTNQRAGLAYLA